MRLYLPLQIIDRYSRQLWRRLLLAATLSINLFLLLLNSCFAEQFDDHQNTTEQEFALSIIDHRPHSDQHFTQGLFFWDGHLYESIGRNGQSALIKYKANGRDIAVKRKLADRYFAEGAAVQGDTIYQLTWQAGLAFAYRGAMLTETSGFAYQGEGWGLTSDGEYLWLSNGSDQLSVINTEGEISRRVQVSYKGSALDRLNELEWVNGWLLANRWYDNRVYVINPASGVAEIAFDLSPLADPERRKNPDNVLNGIAWNSQTKTLWVTGKNWSSFYRMSLTLPLP